MLDYDRGRLAEAEANGDWVMAQYCQEWVEALETELRRQDEAGQRRQNTPNAWARLKQLVQGRSNE